MIKEYVAIAMKIDFCYELMKYNILNVMRGRQDGDERGIATRKSAELRACQEKIFKIFCFQFLFSNFFCDPFESTNCTGVGRRMG